MSEKTETKEKPDSKAVSGTGVSWCPVQTLLKAIPNHVIRISTWYYDKLGFLLWAFCQQKILIQEPSSNAESHITSWRSTALGCSNPWDTESSETRMYSVQFPKLSPFTFKHFMDLNFLMHKNAIFQVYAIWGRNNTENQSRVVPNALLCFCPWDSLNPCDIKSIFLPISFLI